MAVESDLAEQESKRTKITQQNPNNWVEESMPNPNLPHEIIVEILSRLPVKSLLRCRSVSKLWCSLISSPQFTKTHLNISTKNNEYDHHRLILSSTHPHFDLRTCSLYSVMYEKSINAVEVDYPLKNPYVSVWIVGSCNGLLCLAIEEDTVFLWNPSTRQSRRLPNSGINLHFACYIIYGFGYDASTDEYVVVGIFCVFRNGSSYETEVKIYKSRRDSWRRIEDFPYGIPLDDSGKFTNGALHWAACSDFNSDPAYAWRIVALDLSNETYREVVQPNYGEGEFDLTLGVLGELLCVLCNYRGVRADVWVMKEYGVRESWTKLVTIPYQIYGRILQYSIPLCIGKSGEVLVELGSYLILYNPKDDSFNNFQLHNFVPCLEAHAYVESLISPNLHVGEETQQQ